MKILDAVMRVAGGSSASDVAIMLMEAPPPQKIPTTRVSYSESPETYLAQTGTTLMLTLLAFDAAEYIEDQTGKPLPHSQMRKLQRAWREDLSKVAAFAIPEMNKIARRPKTGEDMIKRSVGKNEIKPRARATMRRAFVAYARRNPEILRAFLQMVKNWPDEPADMAKMIATYARFRTWLRPDIRQVLTLLLKRMIAAHPEVKPAVSSSVSGTEAEREIGDILDPPQRERAPAVPVSPETRPELFTVSKTPFQLDAPLPDDHERNPQWSEADPHSTWYAKYVPEGQMKAKYAYTLEHHQIAKKAKFARVSEVDGDIKRLRRSWIRAMRQGTPEERLSGLACFLIDRGYFRIGGSESEKEGSRGLSTLQVRHVEVAQEWVRFRFNGKDMVPWDVTIDLGNSGADVEAGDLLADLVTDKGPDDYLFTLPSGARLTDSHVNEFLRLNRSPVTIHKMRTYHATRMAKELLLDNPEVSADSTKRDKKRYLKEALNQIADKMGHTSSATTKKSYIDPTVIEKFMENMEMNEAVEYDEDMDPIDVELTPQRISLANLEADKSESEKSLTDFLADESTPEDQK